MKKINAFKLSDGQIIENEVDAIKMQKDIDFKNALSIFVEENCVYNDDTVFFNLIADHKDELLKILSM